MFFATVLVNKETSLLSIVGIAFGSGGKVGKKAGLNNLVDFRKKVSGQFLNFNADQSYKNSK